jgi:hypothetical protein
LRTATLLRLVFDIAALLELRSSARPTMSWREVEATPRRLVVAGEDNGASSRHF